MELTDISWRFFVVFLLVAANGFFVASEFALVSVRRTRIEELVNEGNRRARVVRRSLGDLDSYIAATQLGITMASIGLGWVGEPTLARLLDPILESFLPTSGAIFTSHLVAFIIAFGIITVLHIVFGELAPKTIALQRSEATSLWIAGPLEVFLRLFRPIIFAMNGLGRMVVRSLGLRDVSGHALVHSEAELRMLVTASTLHGQLEESEQAIIDRAFVFADDTAVDVMLPRTELVALSMDSTPEEIRQVVTTHRAARYPVYEQDPDYVTGVLHARDALSALAEGKELDLASLVRPVLTVPSTLSLDRLLEVMRAGRTHICVVVDEYGGTAGIVELGRLMARLVGHIPDEFDPEDASGGVVDTHDDATPAVIDGLTLVQDVNQSFNLSLDEERAHTIGGLVFHAIGRTPRIGDQVEFDGARLTVLELDRLRISKLQLERTRQE